MKSLVREFYSHLPDFFISLYLGVVNKVDFQGFGFCDSILTAASLHSYMYLLLMFTDIYYKNNGFIAL